MKRLDYDPELERKTASYHIGVSDTGKVEVQAIEFYEQLQMVINKLPHNNHTIIMDDFNA